MAQLVDSCITNQFHRSASVFRAINAESLEATWSIQILVPKINRRRYRRFTLDEQCVIVSFERVASCHHENKVISQRPLCFLAKPTVQYIYSGRLLSSCLLSLGPEFYWLLHCDSEGVFTLLGSNHRTSVQEFGPFDQCDATTRRSCRPNKQTLLRLKTFVVSFPLQ